MARVTLATGSNVISLQLADGAIDVDGGIAKDTGQIALQKRQGKAVIPRCPDRAEAGVNLAQQVRQMGA